MKFTGFICSLFIAIAAAQTKCTKSTSAPATIPAVPAPAAAGINITDPVIGAPTPAEITNTSVAPIPAAGPMPNATAAYPVAPVSGYAPAPAAVNASSTPMAAPVSEPVPMIPAPISEPVPAAAPAYPAAKASY